MAVRLDANKTRFDLIPGRAALEWWQVASLEANKLRSSEEELGELGIYYMWFLTNVTREPNTGISLMAYVIQKAAFLLDPLPYNWTSSSRPGPRMELTSPLALDMWAKVMTFGARKYGDNNWKKGMKWSRVVASLGRHLAAFRHGELIDPESDLPHMAHVMANAGFLIEYAYTHPNLDDRNE